jgi:hypothetical protein
LIYFISTISGSSFLVYSGVYKFYPLDLTRCVIYNLVYLYAFMGYHKHVTINLVADSPGYIIIGALGNCMGQPRPAQILTRQGIELFA